MTRPRRLTPEWLAQALPDPGAGRGYRIAFSGGVDSRVLLDLAVRMPRSRNVRIHAVHIDHGLHPQSGRWAAFCHGICQDYGIECVVEPVCVPTSTPEGPEAAARQARYEAFRRLMESGDVLVTAHHGDDQAETILLRLLRGSGLRGLSAMRRTADFGPGVLARPLLDRFQHELLAYAREHGLRWLDDPSNSDETLDRNYLRRVVMPSLQVRWPATSKVLARSADHAAEGAALLDSMASHDFEKCRINSKNRIDLNLFSSLGHPRRRNLLQHWIQRCGLPPMPGRRLEEASRVMVESPRDATPRVAWPGGELRRYRNTLYALPPLVDPPIDWKQWWNLSRPLELPGACGRLYRTRAGPSEPSLKSGVEGLEVGFRQGGESIQPADSGHHRKLKALWQGEGVPPWVRERTPLLFCHGALVAVADQWVDRDWLAGKDEPGQKIHWERPDTLAG